MRLEWSEDALRDLDRFVEFLNRHHPGLASIAAREIIAKAGILEGAPELGRPIKPGEHYRQLVLRVMNAQYVFQYRYDGRRLTMLRIFHGRETRGP